MQVDRFEKDRLTTKPTHRYRYFVSGKGKFPFDMLRYDACWPAGGEDAALMSDPTTLEEHKKVRSILMYSYREPTIDRWSSFNWSVGLEKL